MLSAQSLLRRLIALLNIIVLFAKWTIVGLYQYKRPSLQLQCTNLNAPVCMVPHLAFLCFSKHSSNLFLYPISSFVYYQGSLHCLCIARMLMLLSVTQIIYCKEGHRSRNLVFCTTKQVGCSQLKKKKEGRVNKRQQYDPTNDLRDFFKPSDIYPHWE